MGPFFDLEGNPVRCDWVHNPGWVRDLICEFQLNSFDSVKGGFEAWAMSLTRPPFET